jgi:hypothetical protein
MMMSSSVIPSEMKDAGENAPRVQEAVTAFDFGEIAMQNASLRQAIRSGCVHQAFCVMEEEERAVSRGSQSLGGILRTCLFPEYE